MQDSRAAKAVVHTEIVDALVRFIPVSVAQNIVRAIVRGEVPRLAVRYDG